MDDKHKILLAFLLAAAALLAIRWFGWFDPVTAMLREIMNNTLGG